jgi:hypothetical protein
MKATLEFTLPEEEDLHQRAIDSQDMATTLMDLYQALRTQLKYGDLTPETHKALDAIYKDLSESLSWLRLL